MLLLLCRIHGMWRKRGTIAAEISAIDMASVVVYLQDSFCFCRHMRIIRFFGALQVPSMTLTDLR